MKKISIFTILIFILAFTSCSDSTVEVTTPEPEIEIPKEVEDISIAGQSFNAFNKSFLISSKSNQYYREKLNTTDPEYFWCQALVILMAEDVYDRTKNEEHKKLIRNLLNTFLEQNQGKGSLYDWSWNEYNDDILWAGLIFARGYKITGDKVFLDQAEYAYKFMYDRGWDNQLGGGIWWDITKKEKSGLSNNPAISLACLLYEATNKKEYLMQATKIYEWTYNSLFDKITGAVYENMQANGFVQKDGADNVYNSGAFIEAATYLHRATGNQWYYDDAVLAIDYVINNKTEQGIMSRGQREGTWQSEFARGMGMFVSDHNLWSTYYEWMKKNADAAWNTRRVDLNLTWNKWVEQTPDEQLRAVECASAVVMQQYVPATIPLQ